MPTFHIQKFTAARPNDNPSSWDTDGIPFAVDNSATAIISNKRKLFTGQFTPTTIMLKISERRTTKKKIIGNIHMVLTNNGNVHHVYTITGCVLDPDVTINILGIPALGKFFGNNADVHSPITEEETTIKLDDTKSHFFGYHGKNKRHLCTVLSKCLISIYMLVIDTLMNFVRVSTNS